MARSTLFRSTEVLLTTLVPPDPFPFDISTDYLQRAFEGARAWKHRQRRISERTKRAVRILCVLGGLALSLLLVFQPVAALKPIAWFTWLLLPVLGEAVMAGIEYRHDQHLKETEFDPRYNPNPRGFRHYARGVAKYEADVRKVYVSPDGRYHSNPSCGGRPLGPAIPRWKAISKHIQPCLRCGRVPLKPRYLPHPFGKGAPPSD